MTSRTKAWLIYGGLVLLIVLMIMGTIGIGVVTRGGARNIRPGAETTVITEPVRDDGTIDYLAAINQLASEGVRPGANAAVDMLRAFGPTVLPNDRRSRYYAELGMRPLPLEGNYFIGLDAYAAERATASAAGAEDADVESGSTEGEEPTEQLDTCRLRKWTPDEYPLMERWLQANEEPLQWIHRASQQPGFYMPLLTGSNSESLIFALLPIAGLQREAVRILCLRATRFWGAGQVDQAIEDCVAALRISRLASVSPTLVDSLVAIACQRIASETLEQIAASGDVSADKLRAVITQIEQLPPMEPVWKKIDRGERYMYLSVALNGARDGVASLAGDMSVTGSNSASQPAAPPWMLSSDLIDWNLVLRDGNRWYDQIVRAGQAPSHAEHKQAVRQVSQQLQNLVGQYRRKGRLLGSAATMNGRSQLMSDVLASLMLPSIGAAYQAEYRDTMFLRVTMASLWLNVYRQEHGAYPDSLDQLVPTYLSAVPNDVFAGQPIKYRRVGSGYVVYSVGPDETDNGGADLDSGPSGTVGDLAVRVHAAENSLDDPVERQTE